MSTSGPAGPFQPAQSSQIGAIAYESNGQTAHYTNTAQGCSNGGHFFSSGWNPVTASGPSVLLQATMTSGGTCTVDLSDGSTTSYAPDQGAVAVTASAPSPCTPDAAGWCATTVSSKFGFHPQSPCDAFWGFPATTTVNQYDNGVLVGTYTGITSLHSYTNSAGVTCMVPGTSVWSPTAPPTMP